MTDDLAGPVGPVDTVVLQQIRDLVLQEEPLVEETSFDNPIGPTELVVELTTGMGDKGRFEITWWQRGAYRYHYTERDGIDFRFDRHPKDDAPDAHFHPPPDGGPPVRSVLQRVTQAQVVTRVVLRQWRAAIVDEEGLDVLNTALRG